MLLLRIQLDNELLFDLEIELVTLTSDKSQIVPDISSKALLETLGDLSQVKFWAIDPSLFESSLLEPSLLGGGL